MTDVLIRNVDDTTIREIDAAAKRCGMSRAEYLRQEISRLGQRRRTVTMKDLERSAESFADVLSEDFEARAWG